MAESSDRTERYKQNLYFSLVVATLAVCFILPPLFHLNIKPNEFAPGFIPLRMINADLKYLVVLGCMSLVTGMVLIRMHLLGRCIGLSKPLCIFGGLFLLAVLLSNVLSHNPMRAWVSSLQWHFAPVLFAYCLSQLKWSRTMVISVLSLLLLGGVLSCLVTLDQHYRWTDWSHRLVRTGYAGIIFNHNFAAEYHAPLIPLALGLAFYLKPWWAKLLCFASILVIFLPAVSLSMARGAWVGHLGGVIGVSLGLLLFLRFHLVRSDAAKAVKGKSWLVPVCFVLMGLALPALLYTSDFWKRDGKGWDRLDFGEEDSFQVLDPQTNLPEKKVMEEKPIFAQTKEATELKSIASPSKSWSSMRRLVLWEDAFKESFSKDFLFGKGTDHYELFYHESAKLSDKNWGKTLVRFVHNDFIQIFYENGFIGIVGWLGIWAIVCWQGMVACCRFFRAGDVGELGIRIGLLACILCFLIEAFFEFPTRSPCAMFVGWSALGILLGLKLKSDEPTEEKKPFSLLKRPLLNLAIGVVGVVLPIYAGFLIKDLFWANVYHFQGRAAGDAKKPQLSLHFHREAISYAPWQHLSRKAEGFLLITQEKRYLDAMKSIEETLRVHPGCLQAHQNRIALLINEFKNPNAAKIAYLDMKKAAPFHPFTKTEEKKLKKLFLSNREKKP
jgi:hypothetical protein